MNAKELQKEIEQMKTMPDRKAELVAATILQLGCALEELLATNCPLPPGCRELKLLERRCHVIRTTALEAFTILRTGRRRG